MSIFLLLAIIGHPEIVDILRRSKVMARARRVNEGCSIGEVADWEVIRTY